MTDALLTARAVEKSYTRTQALAGVSVAIEPGEVVAVTGPSGAGKSTLLHCLSGIVRPEGGDVTFDGQRIDDLSGDVRTRLRRREFGIILQFGQLVPELTAEQNVALPLLLERHRRDEAYAAARAWLHRIGAGDVAGAQPGELSGGEAQRVAMARALVTRPRVVFADEPTGSLDTVAGENVLGVLLESVREGGATLVLVTHDNRVAAHADREIVLVDGQVVPTSVPAP